MPNHHPTFLIRPLDGGELRRAREIDVSESGGLIYRRDGDALRGEPEDWRRDPWPADEWAGMLELWTRRLKWDLMLGAFAGERLAGLASLRYRLRRDTAQLTTLHVSREARRGGVATALTQEIIRLARENGARWLYVSATPSESAVRFYLGQGFRPTDEIDAGLHALEPEDIHMLRPL